MLKYSYFLSMLFITIFIGYSLHQQMVGNQFERIECWKEGGILYHTLNQDLVCIKPIK